LHLLYNQLFEFLLLAFLPSAGLEIILQKAIAVAQRWNEFTDTCRRKTAAQTAPTTETEPPPMPAKAPVAPAPAPKAPELTPQTAAPAKPTEPPAPPAITPELVGAETTR
jgi:hypothetical protein